VLRLEVLFVYFSLRAAKALMKFTILTPLHEQGSPSDPVIVRRVPDQLDLPRPSQGSETQPKASQSGFLQKVIENCKALSDAFILQLRTSSSRPLSQQFSQSSLPKSCPN
jgi:hypothetical protein